MKRFDAVFLKQDNISSGDSGENKRIEAWFDVSNAKSERFGPKGNLSIPRSYSMNIIKNRKKFHLVLNQK